MSSSRDYPFSFSPDLRLSLGSPDGLNSSVRLAFPGLFDGSLANFTRFSVSDRTGPCIHVRAGAVLPARTPVGLFTGHVFMGQVDRGLHSLALPPVIFGGAALALSVDGSARASRFPSSTEAALFNHTCDQPTVTGEWWLAGQIPCLIGFTSRPLSQIDCLDWNFDAHNLALPYVMTHAEARAWRRAGHIARRCPCNRPFDCPRDGFLRLPDAA